MKDSLLKSNGEQAAEIIAGPLHDLATQLKYLGTGDTATRMGAIELLAKEIKEGTERIAYAIEELARAVRDRDA